MEANLWDIAEYVCTVRGFKARTETASEHSACQDSGLL